MAYLDNILQGKDVKGIIDDWTKELQSHSRAFVEDAQKLADWDKHIRLKRRELLEMEAHLERVQSPHWVALYDVAVTFLPDSCLLCCCC